MEELNRMSVQEFTLAEKHPIKVVLDNVRSLHNVGSVFRTCDAFLIEKIYLCGITGTPPNREIHKTALGATETVEWQYFTHTTEALAQIKPLGYTCVAVEQTNESVSLLDFKINRHSKIALIFGNEVHGVSDEVLAMCETSVEIPQWGSKHSLNVAISSAVVLWELVAQLKER